MELIKNFSGFFFAFSLFLQFVHSQDDELSQLIETTESLVDQVEYEIISEQTYFQNKVSDTLNATKLTKNLLARNANLKNITVPLTNIVAILSLFNRTDDFTLSSFSKLNLTNCKKISKVSAMLEGQIDLCIKTIKTAEKSMKSLSPQIASLKIEYSISYIHFTNTTSSSVLSNILMLDQLVDITTEFSSNVYSAAKQISSILYDIKVQKYKTCGVSKSYNVNSTPQMKYSKATTKPVQATTTKVRKARKSTKRTTKSNDKDD